MPFVPDDVDLGVVGDGFEGDVRHALIDETVADVALHWLRAGCRVGDFGFLLGIALVVGYFGTLDYAEFVDGLAAHAGNHYDKGIDANLEASYKLQELVKLTNLELQTTVNVGKINGGIGANTISPKCELLLEIRYTTNDEKIRVLNSLNKITNTSYVQGTISTLNGSIQRDVMMENPKQLELIEELETITNGVILTEKRGGVSDANIVASCGITTLDGFGPFGDGDHTIKERALKSSFESRIDFTTKILNHLQKNS